MSVTCHVRIAIPKAAGTTAHGQYDFRIDKTITKGNVTIVNPVYSYRSDGTLHIFQNSKSEQNCMYVNNTNYRIKEWTFTVSSTSNFESYIAGLVNGYTYNENLKLFICTLVAPYSSFQMGTYDSFSFTAVCCKKLGKNELYEYFSSNDNNYYAYLPLSMEPYCVATGKWSSMSNPNQL